MPNHEREGSMPQAVEYAVLLEMARSIAAEEGISASDLDEMETINQVQMLSESISADQFICSYGS
jgi:hypothetical protein